MSPKKKKFVANMCNKQESGEFNCLYSGWACFAGVEVQCFCDRKYYAEITFLLLLLEEGDYIWDLLRPHLRAKIKKIHIDYDNNTISFDVKACYDVKLDDYRLQ